MSDITVKIFDPQTIADLGVRKINDSRDKKRKRFFTNLPNNFDDKYVMFQPKKVTGLLADTSNYKTGFSNILARAFTPQLENNQIGLALTWEDSVEDYAVDDIANISDVPLSILHNGELSDANYNAMMQSATVRAGMPLWAGGHSDYVDSRRPRMTMTDIFEMGKYIEDTQGKKIGFAMFDYLQRINRADCKGDMREQYIEIMDKTKDFANAFGACVVIGSQVRREIEKREWRQPTEHDAQETSNFEHTCDGIISLQIPARYRNPYPDKDALIMQVADRPVYVTKELLSARIVKQKKGAFGDYFFWNIDYEQNNTHRVINQY